MKREISNLEAKFHNLEGKGVFAHELCSICRNGCINKELFLLEKKEERDNLKLSQMCGVLVYDEKLNLYNYLCYQTIRLHVIS